MAKIIELRPNKHLLNRNFEKYQFCPDSIPVESEKKLEREVFHLELSASQDSWLEARLFALHNHLFLNPFDMSCWFIDHIGAVWRFINGNLEHVYTLKTPNERQFSPTYNPSINFASQNIAVMSSGRANLEFLFQEDSQPVSFVFDDIDAGIIIDAQHIKINCHIIVSVYSIIEVEKKMYSRLTLLTYSYRKGENIFMTLIRKQVFKIKGTVEYVYVENNGNFFHTASQNPVIFEYDSLHPTERSDEIESVEKIKTPKYCWSQDEDSLTVWLKISDKYNNIPPKIDVKPTKICVSIKSDILIEGDIPHRLESNLTTWKTKDDTLKIKFTKSESGLMWSELLKGDIGGEFVPDKALETEIHSRLAHLCSDQLEKIEQPALGFNAEQLEECDLEGRENVFQRVNMNTHSTSHLSMLGSSNCVLFTQKIKNGQMLCFRHDHDGCVWLIREAADENWEVEHVWTLPGFGYVEASKTNKKFCVSSPDGSFVAIIEHTRHAFLYQKPEINASVGKQHIIDFGSNTSILGAVGINEYLIILTKDTLYRFRVY